MESDFGKPGMESLEIKDLAMAILFVRLPAKKQAHEDLEVAGFGVPVNELFEIRRGGS